MKVVLALLWYYAFIASTDVVTTLNSNSNSNSNSGNTTGLQRRDFDALVFVKQLKVGGSTIAGVVRQLMWLRSV